MGAAAVTRCSANKRWLNTRFSSVLVLRPSRRIRSGVTARDQSVGMMSASRHRPSKSRPPLTTTWDGDQQRACVKPCSSCAINVGEASQSGEPEPSTTMAASGDARRVAGSMPLQMPWKNHPTLTSHEAMAPQPAALIHWRHGFAARHCATCHQRHDSARRVAVVCTAKKREICFCFRPWPSYIARSARIGNWFWPVPSSG